MASRICVRSQRGVTLVELLVVMIIMGIVTTMILTTWFSLGRAYSYTSKSSKAREYARDSMARMTREIRDASLGPNGAAMFVQGADYCGPDKITLYSFFNAPGAETIGATPRLVQFYLDNGTMYRWADTDSAIGLDNNDRLDVLTTNVVNEGNTTDVFSYTVVKPGPNGVPSRLPEPTPSDTSTIVSIDIKLLVDLNPGKSPVFMDLTTSVQPRNLREF